MTLDIAIRLSESLLALAFIQQSAEHLRTDREDAALYLVRIALCLLLIAGVWSMWTGLALVVVSLLMLGRFQGAFNGGSDRMGLLALCCLTATHFMPTVRWQEYVAGYLGAQVVLSYFLSGWVKIVNPAWRNGRALRDVFQFSTYPVSEELRDFAHRPRLLLAMSWAVIGFELAFPLALSSQPLLIGALVVAALFHLANACIFGLNRFLWTWMSVYPIIIWMQARVFSP